MPWTEQRAGKYRACWRDRTGRTRTKAGFTHKAAAYRYAADMEDHGTAGGDMTWSAWCDMWLEARAVESSTETTERPQITKHVTPEWGGQRLERITQRQVQLWVNRLAREGIAPGTVHKVFYLFAGSMRAAVEAEILHRSPCRDVVLPVVPPSVDRFLTREEVGRILFYLEERDKRIVRLLVGLGPRLGELVGLHRTRVDMSRGLVHIVDVWTLAGEMKPYPKGRRDRMVPVPGWLMPVLKDLDAGIPGGPCGAPHRKGSACAGPLLVTSERGGRFDAHNWRARVWDTACDLANLPDVRINDLRHTFASWLLQGGRSLDEVAEVMGHSSSYVTRRYARFGNTHLDRIREAMAEPPATFSPPKAEHPPPPETL